MQAGDLFEIQAIYRLDTPVTSTIMPKRLGRDSKKILNSARHTGLDPVSSFRKTQTVAPDKRKGTDMEAIEIQRSLAGCEFFRGLNHSDLKSIASICRVKTYETGEGVYQQGDFGEHLYVIAEGKVVLERSMDIGQRKSRVVIDTLGKGRVFGCWSTLLNEPHIMMLKTFCQTPATILVLNGSELRNLMTRDTRFGFNVMENLCFLLRDRIQAAYGAMEKI